ncbi:uncharacterized protein TNCV_1332431 [Trichonephila clavipes]|nr:uncharacterized protein TNCV_1332431 [Trichonephila clavipes]
MACHEFKHSTTKDPMCRAAIRSRRWFAVRRILYKGILEHNPRCNRLRQIDETEISTPVVEDQCDDNCLEEAVWSFTPSRAGVDRHALTSPSVIHCQFFVLFGSRQSTASKLASLWNCSAAHELLFCDRKILLLKDLYSCPVQTT